MFYHPIATQKPNVDMKPEMPEYVLKITKMLILKSKSVIITLAK